MDIFSFFKKKKEKVRIPHAEVQKLERIEYEFICGLDIKKDFHNTVTFYGSARFDVGNKHYQHAETLAERLASELGVTVVTGGGMGIMEAANKGAANAGKKTLGFNIKLPREQTLNKFVSCSFEFRHFFARKVVLAYRASAYIFYPGGFGTLDELFEILTLIQTDKAPAVPIILVGNDFWLPLKKFIEIHLYEHHASVDQKNIDLLIVEENFDTIVRIVKKAVEEK